MKKVQATFLNIPAFKFSNNYNRRGRYYFKTSFFLSTASSSRLKRTGASARVALASLVCSWFSFVFVRRPSKLLIRN